MGKEKERGVGTGSISVMDLAESILSANMKDRWQRQYRRGPEHLSTTSLELHWAR